MAQRVSGASPESLAQGQSRPAVIAGLLYLIAAYQRRPCPWLAGCIVRHLECLTHHDSVDPADLLCDTRQRPP